MSDERKPVWPWIVALLIGLPVLYVASFGPACWIAARAGFGDNQMFQMAYWPVGKIVYADVPVVDAVLVEYAEAGMPTDIGLRLPGGPDNEGMDWTLIGH